ncbi:MAG: hypothetical protein WC378_05955 [Opitutaceae bacterium]|jgi:hypothetical protein
MKPFARIINRTWIYGILTAALGIVLSRLVAPRFVPGVREWADVAGQITAFTGLFIIAYGIKRRRDSEMGDGGDES